MRAGAVVVIAVVAGLLGASGVLLLANAAGWIDGEVEPARTVVVSTATDDATAATAAPLIGNRFDPAAIYARTSPGVVTIDAVFGQSERAQGSGFVVSEQGHVLTNSHVITTAGNDNESARGASSVYVVFADGDRLPASIVGWDLFNDTGVIKLEPRDHSLSPLPLGDSDDVVVGEPVAAIGSPFGNANSLSVGVVSAVSRSIPSLTSDYSVSDAIQIDAPINHGNSGGPLLDAGGASSASTRRSGRARGTPRVSVSRSRSTRRGGRWSS